jgi:hypothetical protein
VNPRWKIGVKAWFLEPATRRNCTFAGTEIGLLAKNDGFEMAESEIGL